MVQPAKQRLDSWKAVAEYLGRDVRTVARWEREKGLPVHRVPGGKRRAIFAYPPEIDAWLARAELDPGDGEPPTPAPVAPGPVSAPRSPKRAIKLGVAGVACLGALFAGGLLLRGRRPAAPAVTVLQAGPLRVPAGIAHWALVTLINQQPLAAPANFPQMIRLDPARYSAYEAENLTNIEFFGAGGRILPSWRETGSCKHSASATYWVSLPRGIPAAAERSIYVGFAPPRQSLMNRRTTGEAPALSARYGAFDNGARVFTHYSNFAGPGLPPGWYRDTDPSGQATLRIHDGVFLAHSGTGGGLIALGSNWSVGSNIAEVELLGKYTDNAQAMAMVCSASPTRFRWTPDSVGFQNMSRLEIEDKVWGTPSVVLAARNSPPPPAVLSIAGPVLYADYLPVARAPRRICGGDYVAFAADSGYRAWLRLGWARVRTAPPLGVMPSALVGPAH